MKFIFLTLVFQLIVYMVPSQDKNIPVNQVQALGWIVDKWVYKAGDNITYENWTMENDSLFIGESHTVKDGDTVFNEQLKIEKIKDDVFYTAIVKHNPGPVSFKLVELSDKKAVFENPGHDFPNRITYELQNNSLLYAKVEGKDKNRNDASFELFYTRVR